MATSYGGSMYALPHLLMTVRGDCFTSSEDWQFGLRFFDGGVSSQSTALAMAPVIESWWRATGPFAVATGANYRAPSSHRLTELKVARIGTDGKYPADEIPYTHFYIPPIPGVSTGTTIQPMPPQLALCYTLTTDVPRGLASKGRIYVPPDAEGYVDGTGVMPATVALRLAKNGKVLINTLNALSVVGEAQVMSKGKGVPRIVGGRKVVYDYPNAGVSRNITGVRVGRVIDTIRSRRRSLVEDYQTAP